MKTLATLIVLSIAACVAACGTGRGYEMAFSNETAIHGNSHSFAASREQTFRAVTGTLVQKGFGIDQTDSAMGLIKATRNVQDPKNPSTNYHMTATAYVSAEPTSHGSVVTLSASQQTVLYRKGHNWTMLPLLPIIPIPTSRKFETVVTGEGGITGSSLYAEFFAAVEQSLASAAALAAPTAAAQ